MNSPKQALLAFAFALCITTNSDWQAKAGDPPDGAVVRIVDGDMLTADGLPERIRLYRVDAHEDGQICFGRQCVEYDCDGLASAALADLHGHSDVWCEFKKTGTHTCAFWPPPVLAKSMPMTGSSARVLRGPIP